MSLSSASTLVKSGNTKFLLRQNRSLKGNLHQEERCIKPINSVGQILKPFHGSLKSAVLLGKCSDGLPIFLDLIEPSIGSILVICDAGYGKTHQLQVIVESGIVLTAGENMEIAIISKNPWEWENTFRNHPTDLESSCNTWLVSETGKLVSYLTDICEERLIDLECRKNILLILDDLEEIVNLDLDTISALEWLIEYGPKANIWPIASISSPFLAFQNTIIKSFKTHIFGKVNNKKLLSKLDPITLDSSKFDPGEFSILINSKWMTYRLPMLGH